MRFAVAAAFCAIILGVGMGLGMGWCNLVMGLVVGLVGFLPLLFCMILQQIFGKPTEMEKGAGCYR